MPRHADRRRASEAGAPPGALAAGCELYRDSHTDNSVPHIVLLQQAQSDHVLEIDGRFNFGDMCGRMIGFGNVAPWSGNPKWTVTLSSSAVQRAGSCTACTSPPR